jgi:hypothetical protein
MSVLVAAGNRVMGPPGASAKGMNPMLGVRTLREEYQKPAAKLALVQNLKVVEERLDSDQGFDRPVASAERELLRFRHLFEGGGLFPAGIFEAAMNLSQFEMVNGRQMPFDQDVLILRDSLVMAYKPVVAKIRLLRTKEIDEIPLKLAKDFARAWTAFESCWLRNRENHAIEALQPLVKSILALEPLIISADKERLLPWPRRQHQKVVTLRCLEGFVQTFGELAAAMLPTSARELDHDAKLLLLAEHTLSLRGGPAVASCLEGLSLTPEVAFPAQKPPPASTMQRTLQMPNDPGDGAKGLSLDEYAFKLLGTSAEGAAADRARPGAAQERHGDFQKKAAAAATELLAAFEGAKDFLLSMKGSLETIGPSLDSDEAFMGHIQRYERAFRRAKRIFLEPDNLA